MDNKQLKKEKIEPFSAAEMFCMLCRYTSTQWELQHIPKAMRLYTHSGIYTFEADKEGYSFQEA